MDQKLPLRPTQHAEQVIMSRILGGKYQVGDALPGERDLATELGITRPTLRETLQRLAAEGWVTIRHGRSTLVNDYWESGGLQLLSTLIKYQDNVSPEFIGFLLEVRAVIMPYVARTAAKNAPDILADYLTNADKLEPESDIFAAFDWQLQLLMASHSHNPIWRLILNDFQVIFNEMALLYFSDNNHRTLSMIYYKELVGALDHSPQAVEKVVRSALNASINAWHDMLVGSNS